MAIFIRGNINQGDDCFDVQFRGKQGEFNTVEPLLSGPPLSGHPLLNGQMPKSQKYLLYIIKDTTSIKRPPLLSGHGHLRAVPNSVFLLTITSFERSDSFLKHNFHHN